MTPGALRIAAGRTNVPWATTSLDAALLDAGCGSTSGSPMSHHKTSTRWLRTAAVGAGCTT
jgi:hypothetical protein